MGCSNRSVALRMCYFELTITPQQAFHSMKLAGFLLLIAGWALVLSALILLSTAAMRGLFVTAGLGVEALGLVLAVRAHLIPAKGRN